jgi:hypothetical protein
MNATLSTPLLRSLTGSTYLVGACSQACVGVAV